MTLKALKIPAIIRAVQATPWAMLEAKANEVLAVLEFRASGGLLSRDEITARIGDRPKPVQTTRAGGIQVLPLYGVVAQRMNLMTEYSGGTSTEQFSDSFDAAMADPSIGAIVLDVDSPGGAVEGTPELAARIFKARGKGKKLIAVANPLMASAAYWIGSACDEIVAAPSAIGVGSIGVFCVHFDESGYDELQGFKFTVVKAGRFKAEGNPYEPLDPEALVAMQSTVDDFYSQFAGAVAKHRGVSAKDVQNGYGEGRALTAKQALAAGLVDRIDTLEGVLTKLGATNIGASGRPRTMAAVNPFGRDTPGQRMRDAGTHRVEMPDDGDPAGTPDEPDPDLCPDCGASLDDNGTCAGCGFQRADSTAAGGAGAAVSALPDLTRPHEAKEHDMPVETGTPAQQGADINAAVTAERARASEIRALGRTLAQFGVTEEHITAEIDRGATVAEASVVFARAVSARNEASPIIRVGADRASEQLFASVGENLMAIIRASRPGGAKDPRLARINAAASGMNEGVGSDGGFFLEPQLLPGVIDPVYTEDPILSRVTRIPVGPNSNGVQYNVVDESARTTGNRWGGIQMAWGAEGDTLSASKAKLRRVEHILKKITGAAYLTEEQLEDTPQAMALVQRAFQAELQYMLTIAIFRGSGAGQPLGFQNAACVASQAIEGSQTIANSATYLSLNITKMLSRMPASLWGDAIWLYQPELLPYLMNAVTGTNGVVPIFVPAGGFTNRPFDTILGRPAFASEFCEAVGTPGDIVLVAPSQYHIAEKGGARQAMSAHVRFLNDEQTLKIAYRCDGKPVWNTVLTPYKGAATRAPFITLAVRS